MALEEQPWYWGEADKNVVAHALSNQEDGSFIVRNGSQEGNYTLSVRAGGVTRLARITKYEDGYGFVPQDLFETVVELVDNYKSTSLSVHNASLNTVLTSGIPKPPPKKSRSGSGSWSKKKSSTSPPIDEPSSSSTNPMEDPDWDLRILLERLRITETAISRNERMLEHYSIDYSRCETLHHNYGKTIAELERKILELSDICENQKTTLKAGGMDDRIHEAITINNQILSRSLEKIRGENTGFHEKRARIGVIADELKEHVDKQRKMLVPALLIRKQTIEELKRRNVESSSVDALVNHAIDMVAREDFDLALQLSETPLNWDCEMYLVNDPSKANAAKYIEETRINFTNEGKPTDGIFLIRPSSSRPDKLCMDILSGGRIIHLLISQSDRGWKFDGVPLALVTIGDLVRYYSIELLQEQQEELAITLSAAALPPKEKQPKDEKKNETKAE